MSIFTLKSDRAMLLMIDIQEKLLPVIQGDSEISANIKKLLKCAAVMDIPVKYSEQYPKGLGPTITEIADLLPGNADYMSKLCFSCTDEDGFENFITEKERDQVIVFGIESHICVFSTVMGLLERGINTAVVYDACGSRDSRKHEIAMESLGRAGAIIMPAESAIYQLIGKSGTREFKELLPLFK